MPHYSAHKICQKKTTRKKNERQNKQKQKFFSECAKRREKNTNIYQSKNFMKMDNAQQTKHELPHDNKEKIIFELQEIGWNLSMMWINYKLTNRTKTEMNKTSLRTNNIVKLNINIIYSILN